MCAALRSLFSATKNKSPFSIKPAELQNGNIGQHGLLDPIFHWEPTGERPAPLEEGPVRILVLGRVGCGKTHLIDTACSEAGSIDPATVHKNTATIKSHRITLETLHEQRFKLIDTPGFDNLAMSDLEVFSMVAKYLSSSPRRYAGITGIIYIHCSTDAVESRNLIGVVRVISDVILGDSGLSRLTIMVVPGESQSHPTASPVQPLSTSRAFQALCDKGAKVVESMLDVEDIDTVLLSYTQCKPILLRVQEEYINNPNFAVQDQIEATLGYVDKNLVQPRIDEQLRRRITPHVDRIRLLEKKLKDQDSQLRRFSDTNSQLEQQIARVRGETLAVLQQLKQTQGEYASLRSQLQLQENIEQSDIVQSLKDLNRDIEDIGRSISAFLVDSFVEKCFNTDIGDVTALNALRLPELKALLGHIDDRSSLIASSELAGMPVEDFFDYAIRAMLCEYLWSSVFQPFHPGVSVSQNDVMISIYEDIQKHEPQVVAGKWRANSFKSIYKDQTPESTAQHINRIAEGFVDKTLTPLISHFFGEEAGVGLEKEHLNRLVRLVQTAWEWNSTLKGRVIMLGDFHQTFYPPSYQFDSNLMEEFEPNSRFHPNSILGTIGLGLTSSRAIGGDRMPEKTVILKAVVATGALYA